MDLDFIKQAPWSKTELRLAKRFGLKMYPMSGVIEELNAKDITLSDFSVDDVIQAFARTPEEIGEFALRWEADCRGHDYGEEWDPEEGDQQSSGGDTKVIGIGQGFLIKHTLFYIYAKEKPDDLVGYIKRIRIPHAAKVVGDIKRVYQETIESLT